MIFRRIEITDYPFLREMLYEALFVPPGAQPYPRSIIDIPEISKYLDGWGKSGDFGLITEIDHNPVGAIWGRVFNAQNPGYGFIDSAIPELGMAISTQYRNKGIGEKLLSEFFTVAKKNGYNALSLSVDKRNRACDFYLRSGFTIIGESETAYTMKRDL
jgi:ribosomal protein S18 acetylase RimI-like enzyme